MTALLSTVRLATLQFLANLAAAAAAAARRIPNQTPAISLPHRTLDVVAFPLVTPGPAPERRQEQFNTICGFIAGDPALPATCGSGSHCVLEAANSVVGCCPDRRPCTTGVFTTCVDFNSGPQSVADPYVFTCGGGNLCFQNQFDGGFSQFGCGTASQMGTSVATFISGSSLPLSLSIVSLTQVPSTLDQATILSGAISSSDPYSTTFPTSSSFLSSTISSASSSTSSSSSISSSSTSSSSSSSTSSSSTTTSPSLTTSSLADDATGAPEADTGGTDRTAAIIGGTLSGVAVFVFLILMGIYLWRRKKGNSRTGPGVDPSTQYISPVSGPFSSVPGHDPNLYGTTTVMRAATQPGTDSPTATGAIPANDTTPLWRDDPNEFTHTFNEPLSRIGEEDEDIFSGQNQQGAKPSSAVAMDNNMDNPNVGGYGDAGAGTADTISSEDGPLWQQERRQTRNLMWM